MADQRPRGWNTVPGSRPPGFYSGNYLAQVPPGMSPAMNAMSPYNAPQMMPPGMMFPVMPGSVQQHHMQMMGGKYENQPPRPRPVGPPPPPPPRHAQPHAQARAPFPQYSQRPSTVQADQADQVHAPHASKSDRPNVLYMSYEEYLESFHRFKNSDGNGAMQYELAQNQGHVKAQPDVNLMSEEDYLEYCKKYTAQMGMPFDEEMVRRHYRAMQQAWQGAGTEEQH